MSGELIIILGDLHIPQRCIDIPVKFKELLLPGKAQQVVCTGNLGDRADWLKSLGGTLHITRGDFDEGNHPETKVFSSSGWKIGLIHGHQVLPWGDKESLNATQRLLDCDILIYGHSHNLTIESQEGKYFLNPGSLTGAYSSITSEINPSFLALVTQNREASVYSYELIDENLVIKKTDLVKIS
jgi:vacuolar protein sorting-associated protein 29